MKRLICNEKGFTLIEMLLVLFIVILFSSIVFNVSIKYSEKQTIEQFFKQIELDILETQAKAMGERRMLFIKFSDNNRYSITTNLETAPYYEKYFPEGVTLIRESNLKEIRFSPLGEVSSFGTIRFTTPYGARAIVINIHKGRIRYVQ